MALAVMQQIETAQFFAPADTTELTGELLCYARSVVGPEWHEMESGGQLDAPNPWAVALFRTLQGVQAETSAQQSAFDKWLDQTADREEARRDRIHGAEGVLPSPIWIVLFIIAGVIFVYMLFFADRGERAVTQGFLMGSVTGVIALLLLLVAFLDNPFGSGMGKLQPVAMERTLNIADTALAAVGDTTRPPCDARGMEVTFPG